MRKIRRGATLLVTAIVMSVVTITTAVLALYFTSYDAFSSNLADYEDEKILLRNVSYNAFEDFLNDTNSFRTSTLSDLEENATSVLTIDDYYVTFTKLGSTDTCDYDLATTSFESHYRCYSSITCESGTSYTFTINYFEVKD